MKKNRVELPIFEPLYNTYQHHTPGTAIITENPSITNWYYERIFILFCTRKFLHGFSSPEINIVDATWKVNPYFDKKTYNMQFLGGYVHRIIQNIIDAGYYVYFDGIDDYYMEGKSWYNERHFFHNGCICGYDRENKTYCIYAYDKNWVIQKFWMSQKCFEKGRKSAFKNEKYGNICAIKVNDEVITFSPHIALNKISEYLDSTIEKYPEDSEGMVRGIVVHDYIVKYIEMLYNGTYPYEKKDRRVFRLIWEQKKVLIQTIRLIESNLELDNSISKAYETVVREADTCRMLYASHCIKRRDSVLPIIQKKLLTLKALEQDLLEKLITKAKGEKTP